MSRKPAHMTLLAAHFVLASWLHFTIPVSAAPQVAGTQQPKLTGGKFRKQLELPIGLSWKDVPLREALESLADDQRVTIYVDRRVDPGQKLSVVIASEPLATALESIARSQKLGICLIGDLIYFGKPRDVDRLRTVLALRTQEVARLPAATREVFSSKAGIAWNTLTTPAELLKRLADDGVRIYGDKNIPHDLWPASRWPRLAWIDRLGIIVAQFDRTIKFSPDGRAVALVPIPADLRIHATTGRLPKVSPTTRPGTKQEYTLKIENKPVGRLLVSLGKQLGVELIIDETAIRGAGRSLDVLVSFEVRKVDIDVLLRAATHPAGLSFRRSGKTVTIVPAP